jgi:NAD(P)-dependent dehydrogenase (short-subunit alcohol dehydrogenase family)
MGKRVLITGCSSGIGRATATAFTRAGFEVIATARRPASIDDLDVAERHRLDVTRPETIQDAVERSGRIDVLINNAGWSIWGPVEEVNVDDARDLFEVNVWGPLRVFQAVAPQMRTRGSGLVINISSLAAHRTRSMLGFYSASKAAISRFSEAMNDELRQFGVRACAVELAGVLSDFPDNRLVIEPRDPDYERAFDEMKAAIDASRANSSTSEQVAEWLVGIAREENPAVRYIVSPDQTIERVD